MRSIYIEAETLPEVWEQAVLACWDTGATFQTQYDKPGDPPSRDTCALLHVSDPMAEPRIHRAFPGGLDDLEKYRAEMLYGVHDHWIDPAAGKWSYSYNSRLRAYDVPGLGLPIDQIAVVIEQLRECPYTRRAQAVTWKAWEDPTCADPACLQRLHFRVDADNRLNMTAHMRSNDAYKAAFMNMYAFIELQASVAAELGVAVGDYIHIADSFHIYGSYFEEFRGFLQSTEDRPWCDRVYTSDFAREFFIMGCEALLEEADMPETPRAMVQDRLQALQRQEH